MDLTTLTMEELEAVVAAEKERRKTEAIAALEEIAAKHGFTLAEVVGIKPKRGYTVNRVTNLPRGQLKVQVVEMLRQGQSPSEIGRHFGFKNNGPIYVYAKQAGIVIRDGKVVAQ